MRVLVALHVLPLCAVLPVCAVLPLCVVLPYVQCSPYVQCFQKPEEEHTGFTGAGVTRGLELPNVGDENETLLTFCSG